MSDKSLVRKRQDKAATFVEKRGNTIVATVNDIRVEMAVSEWDSLPSWEGKVPTDFNKPPQQAG